MDGIKLVVGRQQSQRRYGRPLIYLRPWSIKSTKNQNV